MQAEQVAAIRELLARESTLVLATSTGGGEARSAPLFYLLDEAELALYWLSSPESEHSVNAAARPECAAAVFHATERWHEVRGVQMRGRVEMVGEERRTAIVARYCERFGLGAELAEAVAASTLYGFRPEWVRYVDNARGFGYKFEVDIR